MKQKAQKSEVLEPVSVTDDENGSALDLSRDGKWMRLIVSGKLIAAFHVDYVQKVLNPSKGATSSARPASRKKELPANL